MTLSPLSEASMEVGNLTERKNSHTPYMVSKNLSVCLLQTLTPIISGLAKQNGLNFFYNIFGKMNFLKNFKLTIFFP